MKTRIFALLIAVPAALLLLLPVAIQASTNIEDITAPVIVSASVEPPVVNASDGPVLLALTVHITDDLSGVKRGYYRFQPVNPQASGQYVDVYTDKRDADCEGVETDLVCRIPFVLPRYAADGEWVPTWIFTTDVIGNSENVDITPQAKEYVSFTNDTGLAPVFGVFIPIVRKQKGN